MEMERHCLHFVPPFLHRLFVTAGWGRLHLDFLRGLSGFPVENEFHGSGFHLGLFPWWDMRNYGRTWGGVSLKAGETSGHL